MRLKILLVPAVLMMMAIAVVFLLLEGLLSRSRTLVGIHPEVSSPA